jgi:hypothetical protein
MGWKKGFGIYFVLIILGVTTVFAQVIINEIMYDAPGTDTKHEWIEIYNKGNEPINLSGWKLKEGGTNHNLALMKGTPILISENYAVIADDTTTFLIDFPSFNSTLFDSAFTSGLSNSGEELAMMDGTGTVSFALTYLPLPLASGKGYTLCLVGSLWKECLPTPGSENIFNNSITNTSLPNETISKIKVILTTSIPKATYTGTLYDDLFKIELKGKENCSAKKDNITVEYTISEEVNSEGTFTKEVGCSGSSSTGKFTTTVAGKYELCGKVINSTIMNADLSSSSICSEFEVIDTYSLECDVAVGISLSDKLLFAQGEPVEFTPSVTNESFPFTIEYWIEDLFGQIVKTRYNTTNTNKKSWKANIEEEDRVLWIKAKVYPMCKDVNEGDNLAQKMIIVTNEDSNLVSAAAEGDSSNSSVKDSDSSVSITKVTPTDAKMGDIIKTDVEIYKGNTLKYSVSAWVDKDGKEISEKTKVNLYTKYSKYKLSLPIKLDDNCNLKEGKAKVMIEGLGDTDEETISVSVDEKQCGSEAKKTASQKVSATKTTATKSSSAQLSAKFVGLPSVVLPSEPIEVKVKFIGDEESHGIKVWSYVYRGSKCYSCGEKEREDNAKEVKLNSGEEKEVSFWLNLDEEIEEGEYKVKVKWIKDAQKTEHELTGDVYVNVPEEKVEKQETSLLTLSTTKTNNKEIETSSSNRTLIGAGFVAYESSTERAKNLIPYILVIVLGLVCVVVVMGRK